MAIFRLFCKFVVGWSGTGWIGGSWVIGVNGLLGFWRGVWSGSWLGDSVDVVHILAYNLPTMLSQCWTKAKQVRGFWPLTC